MNDGQYLKEVIVELIKGDKVGNKSHKTEASHPGAGLFHGIRIPKGILLPPLFMPSILLLLREEPSHGYSLLKKLSNVGVVDAEMDPSPIYKVLRMLEEGGLAVSKNVSSMSSNGGPARNVYRLTTKGREALAFMAMRIDRATEIIEWFQGKYDELKGE